MEVELQLWRAEAELWEAKAELAQARLRAQCERQIDALRDICRRAEHELLRFRSLPNTAAWLAIERGAEHAWKELRGSFEQARDEFDRVAGNGAP